MSWGNEPDFDEERRKFRNRWQSDEDAFSAADAEDRYDDGSAHDMSFGEHAAGLERDPHFDQPYSPQYNQPPDSYPQGYPPQAPYPPQNYPPQAPYPQQGYPPQAPYPQQGYPPQAPYPPQGYPPQAPYPQQSDNPQLPDRVQQLQNRISNLSSPYQAPPKKDEPEDGIDRLLSGKIGLPNPMMVGIVLLLMVTMVCVMGVLALGSLDRHLGLGIFY